MMMLQRIGTAILLVGVLGLGGCVTSPNYPLMTPIEVAHDFGYSEHPGDAGKYEVSYVAPPMREIGYRFSVEPSIEQAKTMAFDLATLRAAQLAQQSGWQGFDVVDKHTSSDDEFIGPWWGGGPWGGGPWGGPWGGWWGGGWGWHRHHEWLGYDEPPEQRVQAEAKLTIAFTNDVRPGQYRAADVVQQVTGRYPGVSAPVLPAPPAAAKSTT